jgi:hypothetical protein
MKHKPSSSSVSDATSSKIHLAVLPKLLGQMKLFGDASAKTFTISGEKSIPRNPHVKWTGKLPSISGIEHCFGSVFTKSFTRSTEYLFITARFNVDRSCRNQFHRCDETWTPLLDQGLVEASGSFVLLTFAWKGKAK